MHTHDFDPPFSNTRIDTPFANADTPLQPGIQSTVNDVIDKTKTPIDPELVAAITEQVLEALKTKNAQAGAVDLDTRVPPLPITQPLASQSLPNHSASSITPQQTPQNPQQSSYADRSQAPLHHPIPTSAANVTARSPTSPTSSQAPPRFTPPSPDRYESASPGSSSPEPQMSEVGSYSKSSRRDSKSSTSGQEDAYTSRHRKRPLRIPSSVGEKTAIEKAWQPLFHDGRPTERLGQFLRGIAKHLIDEYSPKNSIVVTPGKLSDFFEVTKRREEMYPWKAAFGGELTNVAISNIFQQLHCQHHLTQFSNSHDIPTIPGLTPHGFEVFMIMLIQANPEQEYQRLDRTVRHMPISNADAPSERFPKELPRRLFPVSGDVKCQHRLVAALTSANVDLKNVSVSSIIPPPPPGQSLGQGPATRSSGVPSAQASLNERERSGFSSYASGVDDEDLRASTSSIPIERERKPYIAREGSGKIHEDYRGVPNSRTESTTRSGRSNSNLPAQSSLPMQQHGRPTDIPASTARSHRHSMNARPDPRYGGSSGNPPVNTYTRSDGVVNDIPQSFFASNLENDEQQRDPRRSLRRQQTEEDALRGYSRPGNEYSGPTPSSYRPHASSDSYGNSYGTSYPGPAQSLPHNYRH